MNVVFCCGSSWGRPQPYNGKPRIGRSEMDGEVTHPLHWLLAPFPTRFAPSLNLLNRLNEKPAEQLSAVKATTEESKRLVSPA